MSQRIEEYSAWAQQALKAYALACPALTFLRHNENLTFQVSDGKQGTRYLLRLHVPLNEYLAGTQQQPAALASELLWLEALHQETRLTVQQPVRNRSGSLVTLIEAGATTIPCTLLHWVEGESLLQVHPTAELAQALGAVVAQLHTQVQQWSIPAGFLRPRYDREHFRRQVALLAPGVTMGMLQANDYALLQDMVEAILVLIAPLEENRQQWGLLHSDLHRGNCLVYNQDIRPIDFSLCGFGYLLFDCGTCLASLPRAFRQAFLTGYTSHHAFDEHIPRLLDAFFLLSRLGAYIFMLPNPTDQPWLRERIPRFVSQECRLFMQQESVIFNAPPEAKIGAPLVQSGPET